MNKILMSVALFLFLLNFNACSDVSGDSSSEINTGKFAVQKIDYANKDQVSKSIVEINGGDVNSSTNSYFILKNVGKADITDIKLYILCSNSEYSPSESSPDTDFINDDGSVNTENFTSASPGYIISPGEIGSLVSYSETSTLQLIKILISHGTNANGIGLAPLLPLGVDTTYIVITGISNGIKQQLNIKFSTMIKIAMWQIIYDTSTEEDLTGVSLFNTLAGQIYYKTSSDMTNVRIQNIGNVPIKIGKKVLLDQYGNYRIGLDTSSTISTIETGEELAITSDIAVVTSDSAILWVDTEGVVWHDGMYPTSQAPDLVNVFIGPNVF